MIRLINIDNIDLYTWEFQYQLRRKMMTEDERIKEDVEMTLHIKTTTEKLVNDTMKTIRDRRDTLLMRSDYYLSMPDIKITDEKRAEVLKYRQELRDFPSKFVDGIYDGKFHILTLTKDELLGHLPKL